MQKQTCYWLCVRIEDQRMAPYTCYLVRRPPSPLLFVNRVKKRHLGPLLEAVCQALGSTGLTDMDLAGKELDSLIELAANQHSQVCCTLWASVVLGVCVVGVVDLYLSL